MPVKLEKLIKALASPKSKMVETTIGAEMSDENRGASAASIGSEWAEIDRSLQTKVDFSSAIGKKSDPTVIKPAIFSNACCGVFLSVFKNKEVSEERKVELTRWLLATTEQLVKEEDSVGAGLALMAIKDIVNPDIESDWSNESKETIANLSSTAKFYRELVLAIKNQLSPTEKTRAQLLYRVFCPKTTNANYTTYAWLLLGNSVDTISQAAAGKDAYEAHRNFPALAENKNKRVLPTNFLEGHLALVGDSYFKGYDKICLILDQVQQQLTNAPIVDADAFEAIANSLSRFRAEYESMIRLLVKQKGLEYKGEGKDATIGLSIDPKEVQKLKELAIALVDKYIEKVNKMPKNAHNDEMYVKKIQLLNDLIQGGSSTADKTDSELTSKALVNIEDPEELLARLKEIQKHIYNSGIVSNRSERSTIKEIYDTFCSKIRPIEEVLIVNEKEDLAKIADGLAAKLREIASDTTHLADADVLTTLLIETVGANLRKPKKIEELKSVQMMTMQTYVQTIMQKSSIDRATLSNTSSTELQKSQEKAKKVAETSYLVIESEQQESSKLSVPKEGGFKTVAGAVLSSMRRGGAVSEVAVARSDSALSKLADSVSNFSGQRSRTGSEAGSSLSSSGELAAFGATLPTLPVPLKGPPVQASTDPNAAATPAAKVDSSKR